MEEVRETMTQVICHRGYSGRYPENTLLAFRKAIETGADGIELDVHLTKDGKVVVIHDERVDRTSDGTGFVKDMTLRELQRLDASGGKSAPQRIPTLEEYFSLAVPAKLRTNIELKTGLFDYEGLEERVWDIVRAFHQEDRVIFSSFHAQSLLRMKSIAPEAPCGLLCSGQLADPCSTLRELGLQAFHPWFLRVTGPMVRRMKDSGLEVNPYTPNDPATLTWLLSLGVTSVITNYPGQAMALRRLLPGGKKA